MKKSLTILFTFTMLIIGFNSCKNKAKEASTKDAEVVVIAKDTSEKYIVDINTSIIEWKGFKPTGTHNGTINLESGVFNVVNEKINGGSFLIDMKSIVSTDLDGEMKTNLENHLKGTVEGKEGDFFNVTKFTTGVFEITKLEDVEGKMMLSGNLSLKNVKNNITFPVMIKNESNELLLTSDTFTINRTKWNVNYKSKSIFDNLGDKFINDKIELKIKIKAAKI